MLLVGLGCMVVASSLLGLFVRFKETTTQRSCFRCLCKTFIRHVHDAETGIGAATASGEVCATEEEVEKTRPDQEVQKANRSTYIEYQHEHTTRQRRWRCLMLSCFCVAVAVVNKHQAKQPVYHHPASPSIACPTQTTMLLYFGSRYCGTFYKFRFASIIMQQLLQFVVV